MNKGQSITSVLVSVILAMLGGGSIVSLYSSVAVNTEGIKTNKTEIGKAETRIFTVENGFAEVAKQQSFINGKLDTLLLLNNISPRLIEARIEAEKPKIATSTSNQ